MFQPNTDNLTKYHDLQRFEIVTGYSGRDVLGLALQDSEGRCHVWWALDREFAKLYVRIRDELNRTDACLTEMADIRNYEEGNAR